jgi:hypothetical protein
MSASMRSLVHGMDLMTRESKEFGSRHDGGLLLGARHVHSSGLTGDINECASAQVYTVSTYTVLSVN